MPQWGWPDLRPDEPKKEASGVASPSCDRRGVLSLKRSHPFSTLVLRGLVAESCSGPLEGVFTFSPEVCCHLRVCFRAQTYGENKEAE